MSESAQTQVYQYEVGQLVTILKTSLAGHSSRISSRSTSAHGRITYVVYGSKFGEEDLEETERYRVEKASPYGYSIIDTTGQEEPYTFNTLENRDTRHMDAGLIEYMEAGSKRTAESWREVWNKVETGHCGSCGKQFAEGEQRYPSVGYNKHYRTICFACACSQED